MHVICCQSLFLTVIDETTCFYLGELIVGSVIVFYDTITLSENPG